MLKRIWVTQDAHALAQPPSGGCVLKHFRQRFKRQYDGQPPSGGCVLKLTEKTPNPRAERPAAFRRLCVETQPGTCPRFGTVPAAFRRLCVETTRIHNHVRLYRQPPSGGCVLKHFGGQNNTMLIEPAAFRRLCVETPSSPM